MLRLQVRAASILFCLLPVATGCYSFQSQLELSGHRLPLLTTSEVAIVNGQPYSLTSLFTIRSQLKHQTIQDAYWVGVSSIVLKGELQGTHKKHHPYTPIAIARYALGDLPLPMASDHLKEYFDSSTPPSVESVKREINRLTQKALVQKNHSLLSKLN